MTATPENRAERIDSFVGVDYEHGCEPVTQRSADVAKKILTIVGTTQPGVFPATDDESGGVRLEWVSDDGSRQLIIEVPNTETNSFGTGEIYWLIGDDD